MTESKPDPKPRSAFMPILLIVVGLVICAGVVVAFVPLVDCEGCVGVGTATAAEWHAVVGWDEEDEPYSGPDIFLCGACFNTGSATLHVKLSREPDGHVGEYVEVWEEIKQNRQSTP